jgi:hypothetical protein
MHCERYVLTSFDPSDTETTVSSVPLSVSSPVTESDSGSGLERESVSELHDDEEDKLL